MRLVVFFDLPVETAAQRKSYRKFRKHLIKSGFLMMQESVYSKLVTDGQAAEAVMGSLRRNKPSYGLVQVLRVTEKQFAAIEDIAGERNENSAVDNLDRIIVL